jgi:AcrR family transcriptional regulator
MSPRTPKQFEDIRVEKKNLIMETALEHFANAGYYSTTINQIAKHAGISKGLMYNYFESKEALLKSIIHKSAEEVFGYFDIDHDGYLSEEEFEFFVKKVTLMIREKKSFWRLLFQLIMQNEVREEFLKMFGDAGSPPVNGAVPDVNQQASQVMKIITEYFVRKKESSGEDYDPVAELNMFLITLKGFAITTIYMDESDEEYIDKAINRIIQLFK